MKIDEEQLQPFVVAVSVFVIFEYSFVEEISQMRGVCERHAQDLQYFIGASFQLHVMLHDGNQAI